MWSCKLCNVSFTYESIEQHVYENHLKPKVGNRNEVYSCGECPMGAEGFEDIAQHCLKTGHKPSKVVEGPNYEAYASQLLTALEEIMGQENQSGCNEPLPNPYNKMGHQSDDSENPLTNTINWLDAVKDNLQIEEGKLQDAIKFEPIESERTNNKAEYEGSEVKRPKRVKKRSKLPPNLKSRFRTSEADADQNTVQHAQNPVKTSKTRISIRNQAPNTGKEKKNNIFGQSALENCPSLGHEKKLNYSNEKSFSFCYLCRICGKSFAVRRNLISHEKGVHRSAFVCSVCGKSFSRLDNLKLHERAHSGEKPFRCNACPMSFSRKSVLNSHKLTHSGENPFTCNVCGMGFRQRPHLETHGAIHFQEDGS